MRAADVVALNCAHLEPRISRAEIANLTDAARRLIAAQNPEAAAALVVLADDGRAHEAPPRALDAGSAAGGVVARSQAASAAHAAATPPPGELPGDMAAYVLSRRSFSVAAASARDPDFDWEDRLRLPMMIDLGGVHDRRVVSFSGARANASSRVSCPRPLPRQLPSGGGSAVRRVSLRRGRRRACGAQRRRTSRFLRRGYAPCCTS